MHSTEYLRNKIEEGINGLTLNSEPPELYNPIKYMLALGGKRMRPLLVLMANDMYSGDLDKAMPCALGMELFHNFTLIHDDIMDKAPIRRSKPTVHEKWGINVAMLCGDAMFVKAHQLMMMADDKVLRDVINIFTRTAIEVCEGQQLDMNFESKKEIIIDDYINMISRKTAALLGASLQTGALIAGASGQEAGYLYSFGKNTGIAFQLQDDLLDVYGDKEKFGKQSGGDIISGKKTFLYLKALQVLDHHSKNYLIEIYKSSSPDKVRIVTELFNKAAVRDIAKNEMEFYHQRALGDFSKINLPESRKKPLLDFCGHLMLREI